MKHNLSKRETEVLQLIMMEYTTSEIAGKLYLSIETIKSHRKNLLMKFKARNVAGLVRRATEINLILLRVR